MTETTPLTIIEAGRKSHYSLKALGMLVVGMINNRELVTQMTIRELKGLHKGSMLGYLWLVLLPMFQTLLYVVVVSFVFKQRLNQNSDTFDYVLYVLSGMIPWQIITTSLQQAPMLIRGKIDLVKQVVYPVETLPITVIVTSSFGSFVSFLIFLLLTVIAGKLSWSFAVLPVPVVLLALFLLGISWLFSIVGVLIKDLPSLLSIFFGAIVYVSPVILNESIAGQTLWKLMLLNPLSHIVICFRDVFQSAFHPWSWAIFTIMACASFVIGGIVLLRTKLLINEYI